jgi:hypothetical protein
MEKIKAIPGVEKLSLSQQPPASNSTSITTMKFVNDLGKETETSVTIKQVDTSYFDLYKMKLLAGHNLSASDTVREYVINETFLKLLGYNDPQQALGKTLNPQSSKIPIVGVIQDFQTKSTHDIIPPLAFTCQQQGHTRFHIALPLNGNKAETWSKTIAGMEKAFKEIYTEEDFKYSFVDEDIAKFYKKEKDISRLLNWSAGLAVFISCLGLLGLVIYTTTQRIKEIGVRKVLGASVSQIITLLSKDFLQLVMLAFIIAAPLAWWAMNKWLEDFAYRTTISWWIFAACGVSMIIIALLTLGVQTIRSATANPVKSLRTE